MAKRKDGFTDYEDLAPIHQREAREWLAGVKIFKDEPKAAERCAFKLTHLDHISRRHSDRAISTARQKEINDFLNKPTRRANDDIASGGVH